MPRPQNQLDTVEIKLRTTPQVAKYLDELLQSGLFGKTRPEVAERLITQEIQALINDGKLSKLRKWKLSTLSEGNLCPAHFIQISR